MVGRVAVPVRVGGPVDRRRRQVRRAGAAEHAEGVDPGRRRDAGADAQTAQVGRRVVRAGVRRAVRVDARARRRARHVRAVAVAVLRVRIRLRDQCRTGAARVVGVAGEVEAADHLRGRVDLGRAVHDREPGRVVRRRRRVRRRAARDQVVRRGAGAAEAAVDVVDAGVDHGDAHAGTGHAVGAPRLLAADQRHAGVVVELDQRDHVHGLDARQIHQVGDGARVRLDRDAVVGRLHLVQRGRVDAGARDVAEHIGLRLLVRPLAGDACRPSRRLRGAEGARVGVRDRGRLTRELEHHGAAVLLDRGECRPLPVHRCVVGRGRVGSSGRERGNHGDQGYCAHCAPKTRSHVVISPVLCAASGLRTAFPKRE